jgi:hypothetical protein
MYNFLWTKLDCVKWMTVMVGLDIVGILVLMNDVKYWRFVGFL